MNVDYERPANIESACARLDDQHVAYAGGTDLLTRIKAGLTGPATLLDLKASDLSTEIVDHGDRIELGALVTLAQIERSDLLGARARALVDAASQAATPQIRNRATIAGNLLQRPRCWYYRSPDVNCWLKGGHDCPARDGRNEHHAIFADGPCVAVHPSDPAGALVALGATVRLRGRSGRRQLPIEEFFRTPDDDRRTETMIAPDEVVTSVEIVAGAGSASSYRKAMDRAAWAFALVGVGVATDHDRPQDTRVVLTGVANTPRRAFAAEHLLVDGDWSDAAIDLAAQACADGATPLADNAYKLRLAVALAGDAMRDVRARREV